MDTIIDQNKGSPTLLMFYFALFYILGAFILFPPSIIFIASALAFSHLYGPIGGGLTAMFFGYVCFNVASILVFLAARYIFSDCVRSMTEDFPAFKFLNKAVHNHGAKIVALLRLTYVLGESLITYACATTEIKLMDFILGN